jgi:hypothetical protein
MALQPSLRPLIVAGRVDAPHTLDIFCEQDDLRDLVSWQLGTDLMSP